MDFIVGLHISLCRHDAIMVIIDRLSKVTYFSPIRSSYTSTIVAHIFVRDVVRLHGIPCKIIYDRDLVFTSTFWTTLQHNMGTQLNYSTYQPETDG